MISIVIPVYNHVQALQKALDSIARQTYRDVEIIIIDDGSDSDPLLGKEGPLRPQSEGGVVDSIGDRPPLVTPVGVSAPPNLGGGSVLVFHQDHKGAPAARNFGFSKSKGEYVIFWDADVVGRPDMLEKMFKVLQEHSEASYAYSDFYFGFKKMPAGPFDSERLKKMNYIMTTSLIRREAFSGFDESLKRFQDWDLWLTMLAKGKTGVYIPEMLFSVTPHKGGISHWLPSFAYKKPWRWLPGVKNRVAEYDAAKRVILDKFAKL